MSKLDQHEKDSYSFLAAVCVLFIEHSVMLISSVWIMCFKPRRHGWLVSDLISFLILLSISVKTLFSYSQWWCDLRIEVRDAYDIQDRMHFFEYVQILKFAYHMFETQESDGFEIQYIILKSYRFKKNCK